MQMPEWPEDRRGCWLEMGFGEVPVGIVAMQVGEPVYMSALEGLQAGEQVGERMLGGLRLRYALNLLPGQLLQRLDLTDVKWRTKVPASLKFQGRRLSSARVFGEDVLDTLVTAGGRVPDTADEPLAELMGMLDIRLGWQHPRKPDPLHRPPLGSVFQGSEKGCRVPEDVR